MSRRSGCAQRQSWSAAHTLAARAALDDERTVTVLPYSRDVEGCDVLWIGALVQDRLGVVNCP